MDRQFKCDGVTVVVHDVERASDSRMAKALERVAIAAARKLAADGGGKREVA